jgi:dihydropteroate synthase
VIAAAAAARAEAAGIPVDRIVVDGTPGDAALAGAAGSYAVLVELGQLAAGVGAPHAAVVAAATLALIDGARLLRTTDVKAARRASDVVAAILEAP